jgi:hypothetical protein
MDERLVMLTNKQKTKGQVTYSFRLEHQQPNNFLNFAMRNTNYKQNHSSTPKQHESFHLAYKMHEET